MPELELVSRAKSYRDRIAMTEEACSHSYQHLLARSENVAAALLETTSDLNEAQVAYQLPAGPAYVAAQWGIWRAGGVAVPLSLSATPAELEYALDDSQSKTVVTNRHLIEKLRPTCEKLGVRMLIVDQLDDPPSTPLPVIDSSRRGMMLYTSGTTSKPKGVVTTHENIQAQIEALVDAWKWESDDSIPLFLPLHHIHGIINVMSCALWSGARVDAVGRFDMQLILDRVAAGNYSVFMAVPTIYVKLIQTITSLAEKQRTQVIREFGNMRLMVSGSAALPASVHQQWTELTGQRLLERYGMTEIGMALSNPYVGERRPGSVGQPLPGVQIRLRSDDGKTIDEEEVPGEIQVRGKSVFREYWNRESATTESFEDGWFRTGDIAVLENGYYRIMGRQSVDIIKSGGYKLSALEIESVLLEHPAISQCAVVGVPDETWGEAVAAAIVLDEGHSLTLESLKAWCKDLMSHYKIPRHLQVIDELPRNAMGKVQKPAVVERFES